MLCCHYNRLRSAVSQYLPSAWHQDALATVKATDIFAVTVLNGKKTVAMDALVTSEMKSFVELFAKATKTIDEAGVKGSIKTTKRRQFMAELSELDSQLCVLVETSYQAMYVACCQSLVGKILDAVTSAGFCTSEAGTATRSMIDIPALRKTIERADVIDDLAAIAKCGMQTTTHARLQLFFTNLAAKGQQMFDILHVVVAAKCPGVGTLFPPKQNLSTKDLNVKLLP